MIGSQDILIALALGMLFFGAKKLPELARGLGESLKEFKRATTHADEPAASPPSPPVVGPAETRRCANCQSGVQADWAHCPKCGASVPAG